MTESEKKPEKRPDINSLSEYIEYLKKKYNIDERRIVVRNMKDEKKRAFASVLLL